MILSQCGLMGAAHRIADERQSEQPSGGGEASAASSVRSRCFDPKC